jgi:NitT/TauT family transport system substrate-binding protein
MKKYIAILTALALTISLFGCSKGTPETGDASTEAAVNDIFDGKSFRSDVTNEEVLKYASAQDKIGNQGNGHEYSLFALLSKYNLPNKFVAMGFDMTQFDQDELLLATGMTYNELGTVINSYDGAYGYGDSVKWIDFNDEGTAMLEDNIFCTREFAENNPNTVKAFLSASLKGWKYACENPEEAAQIVTEYGSTVSDEHQLYMAKEVKKLVETDMNGNTVSDYGRLDDDALQQTLDIVKAYISFDDSQSTKTLASLTLDDIRDKSYFEAVANGEEIGTPEKTDIKLQLKWLPQAQFMGYYVALKKGYYEEVGLNVELVPGGGDVSEVSAVNSGTADFGVTWTSILIPAVAGGVDLIEVAQIYQRSGMILMYKVH